MHLNVLHTKFSHIGTTDALNWTVKLTLKLSVFCCFGFYIWTCYKWVVDKEVCTSIFQIPAWLQIEQVNSSC